MKTTVSQRVLKTLNYNLQLKDPKTETHEDDEFCLNCRYEMIDQSRDSQ